MTPSISDGIQAALFYVDLVTELLSELGQIFADYLVYCCWFIALNEGHLSLPPNHQSHKVGTYQMETLQCRLVHCSIVLEKWLLGTVDAS